MDSRPADGSKSVLSAKRWFKARNGTLTVVRIQRTYTRRRAAKRSFKSGQTMNQVTSVARNYWRSVVLRENSLVGFRSR
jgi:hypothetical protein